MDKMDTESTLKPIDLRPAQEAEQRLTQSVDQLHKTITALEGRLSSLLREDEEAANTSPISSQDAPTPIKLSTRLHILSESLNRGTHRLERIMELLEI